MWHYSDFFSPPELARKFERIQISAKRSFLRGRLRDTDFVVSSARGCRDFRGFSPLMSVPKAVAERYLPWFVRHNRNRMCRFFAYHGHGAFGQRGGGPREGA